MAAVKWHQDRLVAFDTETTGTDPDEARIVTAAIVHMRPGNRPIAMRWIIDPGVEVPDEAAAVHGYTNEVLAKRIGRPDFALRILNGVPAVIPRDVALFEITGQVAATISRGQALVVHNAPYDLTLLEHEAARNDLDPLTARLPAVAGVVDPMVIEKAFDPWRKQCYKKATDGTECDREGRAHVCGGCRGGKVKCGGCGSTDRTLTSLCAHYGVRHAGAHDCADDAIATVRMLQKVVAAWPSMASWKLSTLHERQVDWRREQQEGMRQFFEKLGKEHDGMCPRWPLHDASCADAHRTAVAA